MKTTEELQKELDTLIAEKIQCQKDVEAGEKAKARLKSLIGSYSIIGEIRHKQQEIDDSYYPILHNYAYSIDRIVNIGDKWISVKQDGINREIIRYKKDTGWIERARDDSNSIDAQKAIEIWNEWLKHE